MNSKPRTVKQQPDLSLPSSFSPIHLDTIADRNKIKKPRAVSETWDTGEGAQLPTEPEEETQPVCWD